MFRLTTAQDTTKKSDADFLLKKQSDGVPLIDPPVEEKNDDKGDNKKDNPFLKNVKVPDAVDNGKNKKKKEKPKKDEKVKVNNSNDSKEKKKEVEKKAEIPQKQKEEVVLKKNLQEKSEKTDTIARNYWKDKDILDQLDNKKV